MELLPRKLSEIPNAIKAGAVTFGYSLEKTAHTADTPHT